MADTIADLKRRLATGAPEGLFVLTGDDELAREEACRLVEEALMNADGGCDRTVVYGDEAGPDQIAVVAGTGSLFGDRRLVIVRRYDALPAAAQERLLPLLTNLPAGVSVVLTVKSLDRRLKATKTLLAAAHVWDFTLPGAAELPRWVAARAAAAGVRLSGPAGQALIDLVGTNPLALQTELEKLAVYAGNEAVTPDTVREVASIAIPHAAEGAIFQLVEAVADGKSARALAVLRDLLSVGEAPLVILTLIGRQYRQILTACGLPPGTPRSVLARTLGMPSFAAQRVAAQARTIGAAGAAAGLRRVLQADIAIKKGLEPRLVLETLVVALSVVERQQDANITRFRAR